MQKIFQLKLKPNYQDRFHVYCHNNAFEAEGTYVDLDHLKQLSAVKACVWKG